jgi:hypothetical protein
LKIYLSKEFSLKSAGARIGSCLLAGVALLAGVFILLSTARGPGVGGDATVYLASARSLVDGRGLGMPDPDGTFRYLSYYPPLFSLSLGGLGAIGANLEGAARWLNAILFAALVWLTGFSLGRAGRSPVTGLLAALALAVSPIAIPPFSWAMSEPLANFLGFLGLASLLWGLEDGEKPAWLAVSSISCGLSIVTRYASLPFLAAGVLGIVLWGIGPFFKRAAKAFVYLVIGLLPLAAWEVWDYAHSASMASRSLAQIGAGLFSSLASFWQSLRQVFLGWLVPESWLNSFLRNSALQTVLTLAALAVVAVWIFLILRRRSTRDLPLAHLEQLFILSALFFVAYLVFILATYLLVYPTVDVSQRIMLPLHIALIWMVAALARLSLSTWANYRRAGLVVEILALLLCSWYASRSLRIIQQNFQEGLGYNSVAWQTSPTIAQVNKLPAGTILISNENTAIDFLTSRLAYLVTETRQAQPQTSFSRYGDGDPASDPAQLLFKERGAALVLFRSISDELQPLYGERTQERLQSLVQGLELAYSGSDGWIYYYPVAGQ